MWYWARKKGKKLREFLKAMKILLTCVQPVGGIKTFFRYIYGNSLFANIELTFFTPSRQLKPYLDEYLDPSNASRRHVFSGGGIKHFVLNLRKSLRVSEFDLLHSHGFTALVYTEIARVGTKIKHISTAHDVFTENQFVGLKGKLKWCLMNWCFKRVDIIHTVTHDATENLLSFFPSIDKRKIKCIVHGVNTEYFAKELPRNLRSELEVPNDTILLGFFGRFMAQKGFRTLVDAVEIVANNYPDLQFKVCTFGWGGYIREDYGYIASKDISDYFQQLPATDNMAASIKAVDLVVMPSRWEACGLLAMEVLACGIPLVSSSCIGLREVVANTPTMVIKGEVPDGYAAQIVYFLQNIDRKKLEFKEYQGTAVRRFAIGDVAKKIHQLYLEV